MLLFKVTAAFMITGRGVVLTPGLGESVQYVKIGSKLRLVRPDKSELLTKIQGITFNDQHDILLEPEVTKADVPIGTEVWLEE